MAAVSTPLVDDIIKEQFHLWVPYKDILKVLEEKCGVKRRLTWLKVRLKYLHLKRRCPDSNPAVVKTLIRRIYATSERLKGYRAVWKHLRDKYHCIVRRDTVMKVLREIDPESVSARSRKCFKRRIYTNKGPNYMWHIDGYDKLSPYGFAIHGCIDGFSRKIIWLRVSPTNHDPKVVAKFYLESLEEVAGIPKFLRSDYGTENCIVAALQIAFHAKNNSCIGERTYIYGPSKSNVKIEGWWSQLRRWKTSWWIDLFKSFKEKGLFDGSILHKYALAYVTINMITKELIEFQQYWNTHKIRSNKKIILPSGIPNNLYSMPNLSGAVDHIQPIDVELWIYAMTNESTAVPKFYSDSFKSTVDDFLKSSIGFTQEDITHENIEEIYAYIVDNIELV